jgi:hypothetical protein
MGQTRRFAERIDMTGMMPRGDLASTKFCLAKPGQKYLVYLPEGNKVTIDLADAKADFIVEWHNPRNDTAKPAGSIGGGAPRELAAPFDGDAVLFLQSSVGR